MLYFNFMAKYRKKYAKNILSEACPFCLLHLHDAPPTCALLELLVLEVLMFFSLLINPQLL
jgi:hypothetical protein